MTDKPEGEVEIYALIDPRTDEVRYIGKARDSRKRLSGHLRDSRRRNTRVYAWIRKLIANGLCPGLTVLQVVPESEWQQCERAAIAQYRKSGRLLNLADGGDQPFCGKRIRAQNGRNTAKAIHSDPERRKMWHLKREIGQLLKLGYVREETKIRLRALAHNVPDVFGQWAAI